MIQAYAVGICWRRIYGKVVAIQVAMAVASVTWSLRNAGALWDSQVSGKSLTTLMLLMVGFKLQNISSHVSQKTRMNRVL